MSLARAQYYAHAQNQFWPLIGDVIGADLRVLPYEQRLAALLHHRIGLWDVVAEAHRHGSLDGNIRDHAPNDLAALLARLPDLQAIGFNGGTSARIGRKSLADIAPPPDLIALPSSSPAYTRPYAEKLDSWLKLRAYLD